MYSDNTAFTQFFYNRRGQVDYVGSYGSQSQSTTFVYNDAGQVESESQGYGVLDGLSVHYEYDNQGRRTQTRLERNSIVLSTIDYDWTSVVPANGRLNSITHGGKTLAYSYRSDNLLSSVKDGTIYEHNRTYDNLKRVSHLETTASSTPIPMGFTLQYNNLNQRTRVEREDQSYWHYQYDDRGQLTQAQRYWKDRSEVDGQGFTYNYDDIGNRTNTGGRASSVSVYSNNYRNELDDHSVAAVVDVQGLANPTANVTVNGYVADRKKEYFHKALSIDNSTSAVYTNLTISSTYGGGQTATGKVYLPQTPENFTYDDDGNLLSDGRWDYEWDGENRLIEMTAIGSFPAGVAERLEFIYDFQGRRVSKKVYDEAVGGTLLLERKFIYDGWHLLAELDGSFNLVRSYVWGIDLSGGIGGAGGVGGLLKIIEHGGGGSSHYVAYDANGNVVGLVDATSGAWTAQYEYGPFGELIRATGPMAASNPFRFSTKYTDDESGLLYYGMRYYSPTTGRWISRDPIAEAGGLSLYGFVGNDPVNYGDAIGFEPISFGFNAFINGSQRGLWHDEPGTSGLKVRQFRADNRDFGEFDLAERNARLFSFGVIESTSIGTAEMGGVHGATNTGDSHRRVRRFPKVIDLIGQAFGADTAWNYDSAQTSFSGGDFRVRDLGPCKTSVSIDAAAVYPFGPLGIDGLNGLTPDINYDVTFVFEVTGKNQITVTLSGSHNQFPDYEGYANGQHFYQHSSPWQGPNHANLGVLGNKIPSSEKYVINDVDVPACCPSTSR